MKRLLLIIFLFFPVIYVRAQNPVIENLKDRLNATANPSVKATILDSLSMYYLFFYHKTDSTLNYCNQYVNQAVKLQDKRYLILAYTRLSFYYINTGQYAESLNIGLKGLDISERYHIEDYLSALYYDLVWAYNNLGEPREGLKCGFKGLAYLKQNKDPFFDQRLHLDGLIGLVYSNLGKNDSAVRYFKKMDTAAAMSKEKGARVISDWHWAYFYLYYTQQYKKADTLIADGKKECIKSGHILLCTFYLFASQSYLGQNKIDKSIAEAREAFRLAVPINDVSSRTQAASLLNACYEKLKKLDSAYHYLKVEDSLNTVLQNNNNALDIQQSRFNQQINQKEQAAAADIQEQKNRSRLLTYVFVTALAFMVIILLLQLRNSKQKRKANDILREQKEKLESTLTELKSTQAQLIQREKMASLGDLTAGIAHEIQNPLNFVNNFSELNNELIEELKEERSKLKSEDADSLLDDIFQNNEKIALHGKRAEAIVKGMLEHSKTTAGKKEHISINALCDEYLRLSYKGLQAKDKNFNVHLKSDLDERIGKIDVVPQELGRVLLNLFNNAFYAVNEKKKTAGENYEPFVSIQTQKLKATIEITISDNANGISENIIGKIFQPFFTTKPTGQGTGLGLSLAYDIITKQHGGSIEVKSEDYKGSTFIIKLPVTGG